MFLTRARASPSPGPDQYERNLQQARPSLASSVVRRACLRTDERRRSRGGSVGHAGRELLDKLAIPDRWRSNIDPSLALIDDLNLQIAGLTHELCQAGEQLSRVVD